MIVGVSTRAFAESAHRAGYRCRTVDAFGDLDQKAMVENVALARDLGRAYGVAAAVAIARRWPGPAAYVANLENHPAAVRRLAAGRRLLGNGPEVLARVRDPFSLAAVLGSAGVRMPRTLPATEAGRADPGRAWLRKPVRGGGGSGVGPWRPGQPLGPRAILQERLEGTPGSIAFAADGRRAVVLGVSRQLIGDAAFGATGYRYAGSIFPFVCDDADPASVAEQAAAIAETVTAAFGLRGVNGVDFVARDGELYVLEVNPRYTASMELIERATGLSIFEAHVAALDGALPAPPAPPSGAYGKAIVYARRDVVMADTRPWLGRDDVRDLPFPGERIRRGRPVCTVFARAPDARGCYAGLVVAARAVEETLMREAS